MVGLVVTVCGKMKCMGPELIHAGVKSLNSDGGYFRLSGSKGVVEAILDVESEQFGPFNSVGGGVGMISGGKDRLQSSFLCC